MKPAVYIVSALLSLSATANGDAAVSTPPSADVESEGDVQKSIAAEDAAFKAIEEGRWCDAANYFFVADDFAPSFKLARNAAEAAAKAGDLRLAVSFYDGLILRLPAEERQASVARRDALAEQLARGSATRCELRTRDALVTELFPAAPEEETVEEVATTEPPDVEEDPPSTGVPLPEAAPAPPPAATEDAPARVAQTTRRDERGLAPVIALGATGGGVVAMGAGMGVVLLGLQPFFAHAEAGRALQEAQAAHVVPDPALQQTQAASRTAYETWGQPTVVAGVGLSVLGTALATGSMVAYVFLSGVLDDTGSPAPRGGPE